MKTCWLYRPALRRHIEDDALLSAAAELHLRHCATCARELAEHRALAAQLRATPDLQNPPFLRQRILNSLRTEQSPDRSVNYAPRLAFGLLALVAAVVILNRRPSPEPKPAPSIQIAEFRAPRVFAEASLDSPYEAELQNLRDDTKTAIRALAANFMPTRQE